MTAAEQVHRVLALDVTLDDGRHVAVHATFDRWRGGAPVYRARLSGPTAATATAVTFTPPGHRLECWVLLEVQP